MGLGPEARRDSPARPGASAAHVPPYSCSVAPCRLDRQTDLTHEGPGADAQKEKERG